MLHLKNNINYTEGNIPIDDKLMGKYPGARAIFDNEKDNFDGNIIVPSDVLEIIDDITDLGVEQIKRIAIAIFDLYHPGKRVFYNDGYKIIVSDAGIKESVQKMYFNEAQRNLLYEHLIIFSCLGNIIEHAALVNQYGEIKNRNDLNYWNYYFDGLVINGKKYSILIDVRSMQDGMNQYRIQRIELK